PASAVTTGLIGTLALLAGFGSLAFALWLLFAIWRSRSTIVLAQPRAALAQAVDDSLDDLRRQTDARAPIMRIYGNFERALARAKSPRRPWQTPIEFMRAALGKLPLPRAAVRTLTDLFVLARFSRHPVSASERDRAWESLIEIRGALDE